MDPIITTLVSAFVIGASRGATKVGEKAVGDAYEALKYLITTAYFKATDLLESIAGLEKKPDSQARRDTLVEELRAAGALDNAELLKAAEAVIASAETLAEAQTIGVDWQDIKAARLKIGQINARAGAIGFRAARMEILGEVEISNIDASGDLGK